MARKKKIEPIEIRCEGDIEAAVELFCRLATQKGKKELSLMFPNDVLSGIFLSIAYNEWIKRGYPQQKDFMLTLLVEKGNTNDSEEEHL